MTRNEVYEDIRSTFGLVPVMFESIPDDSIEAEWRLFKHLQLEDGPVPNKFRELIGLGIAAATRCRYCAFYHTEVAKLFGASEAEIEAAMHYAKTVAGWSTYVNGLQVDFDRFRREVTEACEHVRSQQQRERSELVEV